MMTCMKHVQIAVDYKYRYVSIVHEYTAQAAVLVIDLSEQKTKRQKKSRLKTTRCRIVYM